MHRQHWTGSSKNCVHPCLTCLAKIIWHLKLNWSLLYTKFDLDYTLKVMIMMSRHAKTSVKYLRSFNDPKVVGCVLIFLISILKLFTTVTENKSNSREFITQIRPHIFSSDLRLYRAPSTIDSGPMCYGIDQSENSVDTATIYLVYWKNVVQKLKFLQRHCWKFDGKVFNIVPSRFFSLRLIVVVKWPFAVGFGTLRVEKEHKRFPIRLVFFASTKTRLVFSWWHFNNN